MCYVIDWSPIVAGIGVFVSGFLAYKSYKLSQNALIESKRQSDQADEKQNRANELIEKQNSIHTEMVEQASKAASAAVETAKSAKSVFLANTNNRRNEIFTTIRNIWYSNYGHLSHLKDSNSMEELFKRITIKLTPTEFASLLSALLDVNKYFSPDKEEDKQYSEIVYVNFTQTHRPYIPSNAVIFTYDNLANAVFYINLSNLVGYLERKVKYDNTNLTQ